MRLSVKLIVSYVAITADAHAADCTGYTSLMAVLLQETTFLVNLLQLFISSAAGRSPVREPHLC